ncbi:uncharacterized protein LOC106674319 [Cimex lectularius]|uniref:Uncharacterized protein n=1 Tax=Cimex lectularius TaxID=79782 RepID=A0A8I6SC95_CIMLE|nr:uncharacterized protein LOC106674319 [Cimex lectularius]
MWNKVFNITIRVAGASLCIYTAYKALKYFKYSTVDRPEFHERQELERKRDKRRYIPGKGLTSEFFLCTISPDESEDEGGRPSTSAQPERRCPIGFPEHDILEGIYTRPNRAKNLHPKKEPLPAVTEKKENAPEKNPKPEDEQQPGGSGST